MGATSCLEMSAKQAVVEAVVQTKKRSPCAAGFNPRSLYHFEGAAIHGGTTTFTKTLFPLHSPKFAPETVRSNFDNFVLYRVVWQQQFRRRAFRGRCERRTFPSEQNIGLGPVDARVHQSAGSDLPKQDLHSVPRVFLRTPLRLFSSRARPQSRTCQTATMTVTGTSQRTMAGVCLGPSAKRQAAGDPALQTEAGEEKRR